MLLLISGLEGGERERGREGEGRTGGEIAVRVFERRRRCWCGRGGLARGGGRCKAETREVERRRVFHTDTRISVIKMDGRGKVAVVVET